MEEFTLEQLQYISTLSQKDIESEIKRRIAKDSRYSFEIHEGECFMNVGEVYTSFYKITSIDGDKITSAEIVICDTYMDFDEGCVLRRKDIDFSIMKRISIDDFKAINWIYNEWLSKTNKLFDKRYAQCMDIINRLIFGKKSHR